ncbi:MAG: response regulator [Sulfurimonas sp.]|uniref:response regulator n=1 Tax=Sulfurimonas sp. TaxID=2022749 RepID=UPI003D11C786
MNKIISIEFEGKIMERLNVLIVEDEIIIYINISQTLKRLGLKNIQIARNAQTALDIASKTKIDLLFSDIKIDGEIDGIEVSKTLQILYCTPVIFITAYKDEETLIRASGVDFIGYLLKPYRQDELEALIKIAIVKHELLKSKKSVIGLDDFVYNKTTKELFYQNIKVDLSKKEQLLIGLLFTNIDSFISYDTLNKTVWYESFVSDNTRRTFIYRIKQKLPNLNLKIEKNIGIGLFNIY